MADPDRDIVGRSYQGQDSFVLELLGDMRGGYFLDSGASNGINGSNTWVLEKRFGWSGICVEPNSEFYRQLRANRDCICLNCCLYDREGPVEFLEAAGVLGGIADEYEPSHLRFTRRAQGWTADQPPSIRKEARTLRSVLRENRAPAVIDYWSLDTEGSELALLRSFPFDEYRFHMLTVEHNNTPVREAIRRLLASRGYVHVRELGIDDGYVWSDERPTEPWRSQALRRPRRNPP